MDMVTTIQVSERTLQLLKQLKAEYNTSSYEEAIIKVASARAKQQSMAGYLGKYLSGKEKKEFLKDVRDESDRF